MNIKAKIMNELYRLQIDIKYPLKPQSVIYVADSIMSIFLKELVPKRRNHSIYCLGAFGRCDCGAESFNKFRSDIMEKINKEDYKSMTFGGAG